MSICYNISPELNMLIYICKGLITPAEFFNMTNTASLDTRRKHGMMTVIDILSAEVDFELKDMHYVIDLTNDMAAKGLEPESIVVLTQSKGMHLVGEAMESLPSKAKLKLNMLYSLDDVITSFGLSEFRQEVIQFWEESKSLINST